MSGPLRIAQIAPVARPVSAASDSSIELIVALLCDELTARGHQVTLFATGESRTRARLHATYARGYHADHRLWDGWELHEVLNAAAAFERERELDVIHSHSYAYALPFARLTSAPTLHTYHINPPADVREAFRRCPQARPGAVSEYHRGKFRDLPRVEMVHNGVDTDGFPARTDGRRGEHLLFLGHLIPRKGPVEAIHAARRAGMRLVMAGRGGGDYFEREVAPLIDGRQVEHVGPVGRQERDALLAGAAALVFPSAFQEPFGLVLAEAMACGTPVAALARCAVGEIVTPGVTGFLAESADGLAACIARAVELDRARVRAEAVRRFDHRRMVDGYEAVYRRLASERAGAPRGVGARAGA